MHHKNLTFAMTALFVCVAMSAFVAMPCSADNLLRNPGFEGCQVAIWMQLGTGGPMAGGNGAGDWMFYFPGNYSYVWEESVFSAPEHSAWPAEIHSGSKAAALYPDPSAPAGTQGTVHIYQDCYVRAGTPGDTCTASVWVRAHDYDGSGFGKTSGDLAELRVQEFDAGGNYLGDLATTGIYVANSAYEQLTIGPIEYGETTARLRFLLSTVTGGTYNVGRVTWDDCVLDAPAPPPPTLQGTVTCGPVRVGGAVVTLLGLTTTTDGVGHYEFNSLASQLSYQPVHVSKDGYNAPTRSVALQSGPYTLDFDLTPIPVAENRLANPSFETGIGLGTKIIDWVNTKAQAGWEFTISGGSGAQEQGLSGTGVYEEGVFDANPFAYGGRDVHDGQFAVATWGDHIPADFTIEQRGIVAYPEQPCSASVWVRAQDYAGMGFGTVAGDIAELIVEEVDADGNVTPYYSDPVTISNAAYQQLSVSFTTAATTQAVNYKLHSVVNCTGTEGRVTWDDCLLDVSGPSVVLQGVVTHDGVGVGGAVVSLPGGSTTTGSNGAYSMGVPAAAGAAPLVHVSKAGYYSPTKSILISATATNTLDFALDSLPTEPNLLVDPGFEDFEAAIIHGTPLLGPYMGWTFQNMAHYCYFWEENIFTGAGSAKYVLSAFHDGYRALGNFGDPAAGPPVDSISYQDVAVVPGALYSASVFARTINVSGAGFGTAQGDSIDVRVQELGADSTVLAEHISPAITTANPEYQKMTVADFAAGSDTVKLRFALHSAMGCAGAQGRVVYDDALLSIAGGQSVATIADAKKMQSGDVISIAGKTVSAAYNGFFYIEEADRSSGIKVVSSKPVARGDVVTVVGTLNLGGAEAEISPANVVVTGQATPAAALGMIIRSAGQGLPATGLYVTMWGNVGSAGAGSFTISDGSATAIRVDGTAAQGDYVTVTGALGAMDDGGSIVPVLRALSVDKVIIE